MLLKIRPILAFLALAGWITAASAMDPVVRLLWSILQDRLMNAAVQQATAPSVPAPLPDPGFGFRANPQMQLRELKALIHENFTYLPSGQREEIYAGLERIVTDPKHVASRSFMIEQFTQTAKAMGEAHRRLSNLSDAEKRRVAAEIRQAYERSGAGEREELLKLVQSRQLPLPTDLNRMVLDQLGGAAPEPAVP